MNALKTAGLQKSPFLVTLTGVVVGVTVVLSLVLRCPLELFFCTNHRTDLLLHRQLVEGH